MDLVKSIIYSPGKHLFVKHAQKYVYGTHNKCMRDIDIDGEFLLRSKIRREMIRRDNKIADK